MRDFGSAESHIIHLSTWYRILLRNVNPHTVERTTIYKNNFAFGFSYYAHFDILISIATAIKGENLMAINMASNK